MVTVGKIGRLALSRHRGESIVIGNVCTITVVDFLGSNKVRLCIEAPNYLKVDRKEVAEKRKKAMGISAGEAATSALISLIDSLGVPMTKKLADLVTSTASDFASIVERGV